MAVHTYTPWREPGQADVECRICGEPVPGGDCRLVIPRDPPADRGAPAAARNAPAESKAAAASVVLSAGTMRVKILRYLLAAAGDGATDDELEVAVVGSHQSVSAARRSLTLDHYTLDAVNPDTGKPVTRATRSGRAARVRVISPRGAAALGRHDAETP